MHVTTVRPQQGDGESFGGQAAGQHCRRLLGQRPDRVIAVAGNEKRQCVNHLPAGICRYAGRSITQGRHLWAEPAGWGAGMSATAVASSQFESSIGPIANRRS